MTPAPFITTSRLEIRPPERGDLAFVCDLFEDPRLRTFLGGIPTRAESEKRFNFWFEHWKAHGFGSGIVQLKGTHERVGACSLFWTEHDGEKVLEVGWVTAFAHQRKGYAFEAAKGYVDYAEANLHYTEITAFPNAENAVSNRILEKLGFTRVGPYSYPYMGFVLNSLYWRKKGRQPL